MNIYFQIAGLIIVAYLIILYSSHRKLGLREERAFVTILVATFVDLTLDALSVVAIHFMDMLPDLLVRISCKSYIISMMWLGLVDFCYVMLDVGQTKVNRRKMILILSAVTAAASIVTASLPIEIYDNGTSVYTAGPAVISVYVVTLMYILATMICAIVIRGTQNSRRGLAVIITTALWMVAAGIQFLNNELLVVGFSSTVGVMILYIVMENPDANLDRQLGCFNSFALSMFLNRQLEEGNNVNILDVSIIDIRSLENREIDIKTKAREVIKEFNRDKDLYLFKNFNYGLVFVSSNREKIEKVYRELTEMLSSVGEIGRDIVVLKVEDAQQFESVDELLKFLNSIRAENEDVECMLHIDFDTMNEERYRVSEDFRTAIPGWESVTNYQEHIEMLKDILVPEDRKEFLLATKPETVLKKVKDGNPYYIEFCTGIGDEKHWYQAKVIHHSAHVNKNCVIVSIKNVDAIMSQKVQNEEMLKQNLITIEEQQQALEEALAMAQSANRAKTTFLNNMSHDIRTPMNAIIGYTGLAASHIDSKEMVTEYLKKISQSSEHLLSLINDILDMSRIESGKMTLNEQEENLSEIVHTIRNIIQSSIAAKNLDFYVDVFDVSDEYIVCDKLRLNQVLLNIISNATKYTQNGGTVSFRVSEKNTRDDGYATYCFSVKDNGIGMSKEFVKTIFEPFTRVKSSTVSGIQGTGLGMAITKNIVDMMGGKIEIKSEERVGTEVNIEFDFKIVDTREAEEIPKELKNLKGLRGLVVDDDLDSCLSISQMLKSISMRSEWCSSGKEAVFRAQAAYEESDNFSVYIIDWMMPDLNGIETARRIRKVIGDFVPIIIITAYDWADIEQEAYDAGVTAFVNKPLFMSDLKKTLIKCYEGDTVEEEEEEKPDYSGKKILLVEDNEMNREIASEILTEYGFVIDTAEDGTIAVEKMKNAKPGQYDVILMDVQMPIMNGYEATKEIRAMKNKKIANIPIIATTANAFEEDRKLAIDAGMNEHIAKPIDVQKLIAALDKVLN